MAGRRKDLDDIRDIINRLRQGHPLKRIARETGVSRKTLRRYQRLARHEGWLGGELPELAVLEAGLRKAPAPEQRQASKAEAHRAAIEALLLKGVEAKAITGILRDHHGFVGSYSSVQRYVKVLKARTPTAVVRIEVAAGAQAQVDFGDGPRLVDESTGEIYKTWVFVMVLSYSRHQYVELVKDQKVATWLACHRRAFEFFGGVPGELVIDNLKAAIVKASFHDPEVQRAYRELCLHYDTLLSPCRPRTPQHKGKVESGVHYVKRNAMAGREFKDLAAWNAHLLKWVMEEAGRREHGTTFELPLLRFEAEKAALKALPEAGYEIVEYRQAKVHPDCHVVFEGAFYSAPHRLVGQGVLVKAYPGRVEVLFEHERVASHARARRKGERHTNQDHYPPEKLAGLLVTPTRLREQAGQIGQAAAEVVDLLLRVRPENKLRSALGLMGLSKSFGAKRLEAACKRALAYGDYSYRSIKTILKKNLDFQPFEQELFERGPVPTRAAFARPNSDLAAHFERRRPWNWPAN